jgi:hypothetical protein
MLGTIRAANPQEYIALVEEPRRTEIQALFDLVTKHFPHVEPVTKFGPISWGEYRYSNASGSEGDWFRVAVCHNKATIALYVVVFDEKGPIAERYASRIPKAKIGKSCITMKSLAGVDLDVLGEVLAEARKILGP